MITIINMSRRINGINDHVCNALVEDLKTNKISFNYIKTRELEIGFCNNCRLCMQTPGNDLGLCHLKDDVKQLFTSILSSDFVIVSSPINCYDLPSIMKIILERMSVFCYWNDDMYSPKVRNISRNMSGILITTSAMPNIMVPFVTSVRKTFKLFAKPFGIKKISYFHLGFKGRKIDMVFTEKNKKTIHEIVKIISSETNRFRKY